MGYSHADDPPVDSSTPRPREGRGRLEGLPSPDVSPRSAITGVGTDPQSATQNALVNAVSQMVGILVDAETIVSNDKIVRDQVLTYSRGFVEDHQEILWRLRALYGLKNTIGRRIVCVGGPGGWSCPQAPELARQRFQVDMVTVPVPEVGAMIEAGRKRPELMTLCRREAKEYIGAGNVKLSTTEEAVAEAFLLKKLFRELMAKSEAFAVTTSGCMSSYAWIMPCLTLTLVNDDGYMAYCESDFVNIPAGILTHFICGSPFPPHC